MTTAGTPQPNWDTPAELGQPAAKLGQPGRVGRPMQGWDDPVKWDSLPQGGMARSWDTPAKLGQPTQAGTSHTNWADPIFSRLLSNARHYSARRMPRPPPRAPHMCARSSLHRAADTRVVCHVHRNRPPMDAPNSTNDNAASTRDPTAEFSTAAREYRHQTYIRLDVRPCPRGPGPRSQVRGVTVDVVRCTAVRFMTPFCFLIVNRGAWSLPCSFLFLLRLMDPLRL